MLKKIILASLLSVILTAPLYAGETEAPRMPPKPKMEKMFLKLDTNKDGVIDESEFLAVAKAKFAKRDLNKDGKIDKDELQKTARKFPAHRGMDKKAEHAEKPCAGMTVCRCPMMKMPEQKDMVKPDMPKPSVE